MEFISFIRASSDSHRNVIRNNRVHDNGSFGILIGSGQGNLAYNNLVWNNGLKVAGAAGGMRIGFEQASGSKLFNNTIYGNTGSCIIIATDGIAQARNNICWQNSTNAIVDKTGTAVLSNNLFTNPSFVNVLGRLCPHWPIVLLLTGG